MPPMARERDVIDMSKVEKLVATQMCQKIFKLTRFEASYYKGHQMKKKIKSMQRHQRIVRARLLAQAKPKDSISPYDAKASKLLKIGQEEGNVGADGHPTDVPAEEEVIPEFLTQERQDRLMKKLRRRWNRRTRRMRMPKRVNEPLSKLQPIAQDRLIHPKLRNMVEAVKAIEQYNVFAPPILQKLKQNLQTAEATGRAREHQPTALKKLLRHGAIKRGTRFRPKPKPDAVKDEAQSKSTQASSSNNQLSESQDAKKQDPKGKAKANIWVEEKPPRLVQLRSKPSPTKGQDEEQPRARKLVKFKSLPKWHSSHYRRPPRPRTVMGPPPLPARLLNARGSAPMRSPIASPVTQRAPPAQMMRPPPPPPPPPPPATNAAQKPPSRPSMAGNTYVDRSRDPRLRGRLNT